MSQDISEIESCINKQGITSLCFSPDRTCILYNQDIAVGNKSEFTIDLYKINSISQAGKFELVKRIKEHTQTISVLDWSSKNQLLSGNSYILGSHDRQVIVWNMEGSIRQTECIIQQNNRGVLTGSWNPTGTKWAIGTGSKKLYVGYFSSQENWWASQMMKGFKSSILDICFHPTGHVVSVGCADYTLQIRSVFINTVDSQNPGLYGNETTFGEKLIDIKMNSWVEGVAMSPYGLAAVSHNCHIKLFAFQEESNFIENNIPWQGLPFTKILFINENMIVATGYHNKPVIFKNQENKWTFWKELEENETSLIKSSIQKSKVGQMSNIFEKNFKNNTLELNQHKLPIRYYYKKSLLKQYNKEYLCTADVSGCVLFWKIE